MKAEHWPAKQVTCGRVVACLFTFIFCGRLAGEKSALDGAEQAAPLVVVHIDVGGTSLARETVSGPFLSQFQSTLQTVFTPFFDVQFHAFPSQFLGFVVSVSWRVILVT